MKGKLKSSGGELNGGETATGSAWRIQQQLALMKAIESAGKGDFADSEEVERFFKQFGPESAPA